MFNFIYLLHKFEGYLTCVKMGDTCLSAISIKRYHTLWVPRYA